MLRKVKFQEGGAVSEPSMSAAERRRMNMQRLNERRAARQTQAQANAEVERFNQRMREGTLTPEEMRRAGGRSDVERFSERAQRGTLTADDMRRMGGTPTEQPSAPRQQTPAPSMRDAVRPVAPGTRPTPADSMRDAVRPVTQGTSRAARLAGPAGGAAMATGLALEALRRYREGRGEQPITGEFEQGMEPEGTQEAADAMRQAAEPMPTPPIPPRRARPAGRREMSADDLNEIVLRLNRGAVPQTEVERRLADRMGIAYRKGGLVKPKKFQVGGPVKVPFKTPGPGGRKARVRMRDYISPEERKELDAPLTRAEKDRMAENGFKKGGAIKAPVKKMKVGGKVPAPKKMMKGGMVAKPKAKMAKYAKGGMAKGKK